MYPVVQHRVSSHPERPKQGLSRAYNLHVWGQTRQIFRSGANLDTVTVHVRVKRSQGRIARVFVDLEGSKILEMAVQPAKVG